MRERKFVRISISLYPEDVERLKKISQRSGLSQSEVIRFILKGVSDQEKFLYYKKLLE